MKTTVSEMKTHWKRLIFKLDIAEENTGELEYIAIEIIQDETQQIRI